MTPPHDIWADRARLPEHEDVDRARFENDIVAAGRPAIIRGLAADWPAVAAARDSDHALARYLLRFATPEPVKTWVAAPELAGRYGYSDDMKALNHERHAMPLKQLLDLLLVARGDPEAPCVYAGGVPVPQHLPGLEAETPNPLLDPARERLTSLWIGNHSRTAAHWDLPQNLACVVAGTRRVMLFPTDQVANLYVGPLDFTLAGQPTSLVDLDHPDFERFPRFRDALDHAEVAELAPGDALYVPSLWWHHVETPGPFGAMINFWWRETPELATPLFTLFHALLTLRDLPARERMAWRIFFDHYIFQTGGDPMAHLPPDARGVFGPMTPEALAWLKRTLAGPLTR